MSLIQAILIGFVYYITGSAAFTFPFYTLMRPLMGGFVVGLIMGDPVNGALVGARINLIFLGFIGAGGAYPGDMSLSGQLGTAIALTMIKAGTSLEDATTAALALAGPLAIIGNVPGTFLMTFNSVFINMARQMIDKGQEDRLSLPFFWLPMGMKVITAWIPCALAAYFGGTAVQAVFASVPGWVLAGFGVVAGLLPAVGIAVTLTHIFKGEARPFLFVGFLISAYTAFPTMGVAILAVICALVYVSLKYANAKA